MAARVARVRISRAGVNDPELLLRHFLREAARKSLDPGAWDCGLWLADWIALWLGVPDPAAELRGRYASLPAAERLVGPLGFPVAVGRLARGAGLVGTREPATGAVGVLLSPQGPVGAIRTKGGWAVLSSRGGLLRVGPEVRVMGAWEPERCQP